MGLAYFYANTEVNRAGPPGRLGHLRMSAESQQLLGIACTGSVSCTLFYWVPVPAWERRQRNSDVLSVKTKVLSCCRNDLTRRDNDTHCGAGGEAVCLLCVFKAVG